MQSVSVWSLTQWKSNGETPFDAEEIRDVLCSGRYSWLWVVHCETSTGVLNDLVHSKSSVHNTVLHLPWIVSVQLGQRQLISQVSHYASGVSGKGLLSYTGLSFVFP